MKKDLTLLLVVIFLTSLVTLQPALVKAQSKTIVVPDDYSTIQAAIDHANAGDTVFVRDGIYNETLVVNKTISLVGEDRDLTIIDAQKSHSPAITIQGSNIVVTNFTLGNAAFGPATSKYWAPTPGEGTGITIFSVSNYITITNNTIIDCGFAGIQMYFSKYSLVTDNTIIGSPYAVSVECIYSTIANNTFATSEGIFFPTYEVATNEGRWVVNESNTIQGNQNITLTSIPSPFPSISPSPSPTPTIPEFPSAILGITFLITATLLGTVVIKRKQSRRRI